MRNNVIRHAVRYSVLFLSAFTVIVLLSTAITPSFASQEAASQASPVQLDLDPPLFVQGNWMQGQVRSALTGNVSQGEAADDFTVPADGWEVGAVSVTAASNPARLSVRIYADGEGQPGAVVCAYNDRPTIITGYSSNWTLTVTFPISCDLSEGTYWLQVYTTTSRPLLSWGASPANTGAYAKYRDNQWDSEASCPYYAWVNARGCLEAKSSGRVGSTSWPQNADDVNGLIFSLYPPLPPAVFVNQGEPLSLAEAGGVQTFTYTLSTQPRHSADVSFSVAVSDPAQCTASASTVTIPNAAWETGAQVTVTAIDDAFDDGDQPCHLLTGDPASSDPAYDALTAADTPDNAITILDDDTAGVLASPTGPLSLAESGGSETVTFTLDAQPMAGADVSFSVAVSDPAQCTLSASTVTIPNAGWETGAQMTVTATNDAFDDGDLPCNLITGDPASSDPVYAGLTATDTPDIAITIVDNDIAGISVSPTGPLSLAESGGSGTVTFTLDAQPMAGADVSFSVAVSDPAQCALSLSSVTIPNASWNTGAQVTITAIDDAVDDGDLPCHLLTGDPASGDPAYDALTAAGTPDIAITILDNDIAGISVSPTGPLSLPEFGGLETVTFTLDTQPLNGLDVIFNVTVSDPAQCALSASTVTIPNAAWNTGAQVTVTAIDDAFADGDQPCNLVTGDPTSGDSAYAGLTADDTPDIAITILDNDTTGVNVAPTSGLVTTEAGGTAAFTLSLSIQPAGGVSVTIPLSSSHPAEGTVPASVTIPADEWASGVFVTVTGQDDRMVDGDVTYSIITGAPISSDPAYAALAADDIADVTVTNLDDDVLIAHDDVYAVNEGQLLSIDAASGVLNGDRGGNGDPLSAVLESSPSNGVLALNPDGSFGYTPNPGFTGQDTFTYYATDGTNNSRVATVTIQVALVNRRLIAHDDGAETSVNTAVQIDVLANDWDEDGDPLQITALGQPGHGQASLQSGTVVYIPEPGFVGQDAFTYTVTDPFGTSGTATVIVTIWQPVPLCADYDGSTNEIIRADVPAGSISGGSVFCRTLVDRSTFVRASAEIGRPEVISRGVLQAVDVFGLLHDGSPTTTFDQPVTVCLLGAGQFLFLDATVSPRAVVEQPVFLQGGYTCASVPNAGTAALVQGAASAVAPSPGASASGALNGCMVTTRNIVNLRAEPDTASAVLRMVPYDVTLTALERAGGWFYVDYLGERGWTSADYVTPRGMCE